MSLGRRRFLVSASAGSAAYLAGCAPPGGPPVPADGGPACPTAPELPPPDLDFPPPAYFDQLSMDIDAATIGTPIVLVDLDRMEANIDVIVGSITGGPTPKRFRIVEKSLPSIDLLRLVSARAGSESFLVLHLPLLPALLAAFPGADVISGKTHLTSAVERFFSEVPMADWAATMARVVFLADGEERVMELRALTMALRTRAADPSLTLRIAVEIDVGLRRSGVWEPAGLPPVLMALESSPELQFAGLFGYDGHVVHTPGSTADAAREAWAEVMLEYGRFVTELERFPALMRDDLIFHGGGTTTFDLYREDALVNDVATGGGVLRPGDYRDFFIPDLSPAIWVAAPVLRQYDAPELPFFGDRSRPVFGDRQGITVYGGGWPSFFSHPRVAPPPFSGGGAGGASWVPNQGLLTAAVDVPLEVGDWIFFHPTTSEVIFQFERIHQVRGGHLLPETLAAYPRRY